MEILDLEKATMEGLVLSDGIPLRGIKAKGVCSHLILDPLYIDLGGHRRAICFFDIISRNHAAQRCRERYFITKLGGSDLSLRLLVTSHL